MFRKNKKWNAVIAAVAAAGLLGGCSMNQMEASIRGLTESMARKSSLVNKTEEYSLEEYECESMPEAAGASVSMQVSELAALPDACMVFANNTEAEWNTEEYRYNPENGWMAAAASRRTSGSSPAATGIT